jgi:Sec-independent protein translocase protein TatA
MRRGTWVIILIVAAVVVLGAIALHQPGSGMASWLRSLHGARP